MEDLNMEKCRKEKHDACTWSLTALKVTKIYTCSTCHKIIQRTSTLNLISIQAKHQGTVLKCPLKCDACDKSFYYSGSMSIHKRHHTGSKPHNCVNCNLKFKTSAALQIHKQSHTLTDGGANQSLKEDDIPKETNLSNNDSDDSQSNIILKNGEFKNKTRHKRKATPIAQSKGKPKHVCEGCDKQFPLADNLQCHMRECRKTIDNSDTVNEQINSKDLPYGCDANKDKLCTHKRLNSDMLKRSKDKIYKSIKCDACDKRFTRLDKYKIHQRVHSGEKPYQCEICQRGFSVACSLRNHVRIHTGEKPYSCQTCRKVFRQLSGLQIHMQTYHRDKKHLCCICNKLFPTAQGLRSHTMTHTQENPFTCHVCGLSFRQKRTLEQHLRNHTETVPYACKVCDKAYQTPNGLKLHMMNHSGDKPHICEMCGKRFTCSSSLRDHQRSHTGERPFACRECSRSFATKSKLTRHAHIHWNARQHVCEHCKKSFTRSDTLKCHMRLHVDSCLTCQVCGKKLASKKQFDEHVLHCEMSTPSSLAPLHSIITTIETNTVQMTIDRERELAGTLVQLSQNAFMHQ